MSVKDAVIEMIRNMPDDVTTADVLNELTVRLQIDEGLKQLDDGEGVPHQQAKARFARWLT